MKRLAIAIVLCCTALATAAAPPDQTTSKYAAPDQTKTYAVPDQVKQPLAVPDQVKLPPIGPAAQKGTAPGMWVSPDPYARHLLEKIQALEAAPRLGLAQRCALRLAKKKLGNAIWDDFPLPIR